MATKTFKIGLSNADKQNMAQDVYERLIAMCFDEYDSTKTYNKGDFVVYENPSDTFKLYKCNSDNVTGAWDSSKWDLATFQDLVDDIESAVAFVNDKANVDGNYPTMTVGVADQLSPYDDESGDDQEEPFSFQATGTGNGTQPDFSTGSIALMKEKQGNTVCVNQYVPNNKKTFTSITNDTKSIFNLAIQVYNNGVFVSTLYNQNIETTGIINLLINIPSNVNGNQIRIKHNGISNDIFIATVDMNATQSHKLYFTINMLGVDPTTVGGLSSKDLSLCDLTQWFNGDIPSDLLTHPENFFRYYQGSLAYNQGELVNANGRYIKCIGMNQWDEEWELGGISWSAGTDYSASDKLRTKNYTRVNSNTEYYAVVGGTGYGYDLHFYDKDKNHISADSVPASKLITTPPNCCFIRFAYGTAYGTTYRHDTSINLYYEDEARCLTYEPYEVLTNNDTGTEVLRSAGNVKDSKAPDGTITRRIGVVDLGSLDWAKDNTQEGMFATSGIQTTVKKYRGANFLSKIYINSGVSSFANMPDMTAQIFDSGAVYCKNLNAYSTMNAEQFKTAMSGVYLFYELAEPTTEQGTPYSENLVIDDFGTMDFQGTNGVPQGNLIFYPVDYKAFIDTLYDYTEGTPSNVALKSDLAVVNEKIGAKIPECPTTTDGTYVLKATVADGEVVYNWVLEE